MKKRTVVTTQGNLQRSTQWAGLRTGDPVVVNENELAALAGCQVDGPESAIAAAHRVRDRGATSVVATLGAAGAILAIANPLPYACVTVWEAHRTREFEAAKDWQNRILPAAKLIDWQLAPLARQATVVPDDQLTLLFRAISPGV